MLRVRVGNDGKSPSWPSYGKLHVMIEKEMFSNTGDLLPIVSFSAKINKEDQQKYDDSARRTVERDYTEKQVHLLSE